MQLCRVSGTVVAPHQHARLNGRRLLLVERIDLDGTPTGKAEEIALDPGLDAGVGDYVLTAKEGAVVADLFDSGPEATQDPMPANVVIVSIVEGWTPSSTSIPEIFH